jgi:hypothetical protein
MKAERTDNLPLFRDSIFLFHLNANRTAVYLPTSQARAQTRDSALIRSTF